MICIVWKKCYCKFFSFPFYMSKSKLNETCTKMSRPNTKCIIFFKVLKLSVSLPKSKTCKLVESTKTIVKQTLKKNHII